MHLLMEASSIQWPLLAGLIASMVHVWAGPDHLAAVVPLVFERARKHWKIGAAWGLGHVAGMLLIGLLYYFFKDLIPVDSLSQYSEVLVGFILIAIGIRAIYRANKAPRDHEHPHLHQDEQGTYVHIHEHHHNQHAHKHKSRKQQDARTAAGIGIIHGFAGISHFLIMLPVLGYDSDFDSAQYLIGFALGTVIAMAFFAWILGRLRGVPSHDHRPGFLKVMQWSGGIIAIVVGIAWLFL